MILWKCISGVWLFSQMWQRIYKQASNPESQKKFRCMCTKLVWYYVQHCIYSCSKMIFTVLAVSPSLVLLPNLRKGFSLDLYTLHFFSNTLKWLHEHVDIIMWTYMYIKCTLLWFSNCSISWSHDSFLLCYVEQKHNVSFMGTDKIECDQGNCFSWQSN